MTAETQPPPPAVDPRAVYQARRDQRASMVEALDRRDARIAYLRLVVFAAGLLVAWLSLVAKVLSPLWLAVPVLAFVALMLRHDRVIRALRRARRAVAFWEQGLARLDDRWAGTGIGGERFALRGHPYADDLDLFGPGSIFELICAARTRAGEETLARWLTRPEASPSEIRARQAAVAELRHMPDLREALALAGDDVRLGVNADALRAWTAAPFSTPSRGLRTAAFVLSAAALLSLAGWIVAGQAFRPAFLLCALGVGAVQLATQAHTRTILDAVDKPARDLRLLVSVIALIERQCFQSPRLIELQRQLDAQGASASRAFTRLARLVELIDSLANVLFAPLAFLLHVPLHLAVAIESWRAGHGPDVVRWLAALGEIEALGSLAAFAFERPRNVFPELVESGSLFVAMGLGHPLIPEARCVTNDICLDHATRLLVVSGSNMSGKSALLRAVGVNVALALAGGVVCARELRLSPLALGATMRIHDSLRDGESHFFAEIQRIRSLMDITAGARPLLFLLDELLQGTNSHDRRIAAEAIVRAFVQRGAVGLITTHDLALSEIADALAPQARNVHFQDELTESGLTFDYRLRPGIVTRSNALDLMRSVGLEV
jgi:hypothetical protein